MKQFILTLLFLGFFVNTQALNTDPIYKLAPVSVREKQARPDLPGILLMDFGWSFLQDEPAPMQINNWGSQTVNFYYLYELQIKNSGLYFLAGVGVGLDRYKFDNDFTLTQSATGEVNFLDIESIDPKKSQLIANYVDIPVEFRYYVNKSDPKRSFFVGFGGKFGILFDSHTKLKYDDGSEMIKVKDKKSFGLNQFRYGLTGRIGYGGFNAFGYFSLSELFEDGPAGTEDTANFTIGLSFNLF